MQGKSPERFSFDKKFISGMIVNVTSYPLNWSGEAGKEAK